MVIDIKFKLYIRAPLLVKIYSCSITNAAVSLAGLLVI